MDTLSQPNQDRARQVVKDYLTAAGRSASALAEEAHLHRSILSRWLAGRAELSTGSALKLYTAIERGLASRDRQDFVSGCGLPAVLLADLEPEHTNGPARLYTPLGAATCGHYLMLLGHQTCDRSWEEAIPIFRAAESAFGTASSAAAMAACCVAQVSTNLGDYATAQQEFLAPGTHLCRR